MIFIIKLNNKYRKLGYQPKIIYNDKRHQYGGSELMYSINFILERLNNVNMYQIFIEK